MKTWTLTIGLVVAIGLGITFVAKNSLHVSNSDMTLNKDDLQLNLNQAQHDESANSHNIDDASSRSASQTDTFVSELIEKLKNSYSENIHLLHIQASLIKVKEFVLQRYPEDGEAQFTNIIVAAFPDHADSILSILERLDEYQEWLVNYQPELLAMDASTQQGVLWEKRREFFGEDAERIWAQELAEMSQQQTAMHQVIETLNQAHEISMDEKLYQLQTAISEHHQGSIQDMATSGSVISKAFFNLESVQQELHSLEPEVRQEKINDIRGQLGLTDEQIDRLQKQDEARNARWDNGLAYMEERELLLASVTEYERHDALNELRVRYFKHEAPTIQREEESDFWRYNRRRVYGNN